MRNKKENIDDDNGVSILSSRLNGEQLDDDTINKLMTPEKEEKETKKRGTKEINNINDGGMVNSETDICQTEDQNQSITYNNMNEPKVMQETGNPENIFSEIQDNRVPVYTAYIPTEQPTIHPGTTIHPRIQQMIGSATQQYVEYPTVSQPVTYNPITQQPIVQQPVYSNEIYTDNTNYQKLQSQPCVKPPRKRISTRGRRSLGRRIFDAIIYKVIGIAVIAAIIFLLTKYVFGIVKLDNEYMLPTYDKGETLVTEKISRYFGSYSLNDIVIIKKSDKIFAARVIGCPGDTISINEEGNIYINGEVYEETEKFDVITDAGAATEEIKLGSKEFFVLSDNRNNSFDSRNVMVGVVKKSEIYGSVLINFNFDN